MDKERFEKLAKRFYKDTGLMAPGKDDILYMGCREKRRSEWEKWLKDNNIKWSTKG